MSKRIVALFIGFVAVVFAAGCTQIPVRAVNEPLKEVFVDELHPAADGRGYQIKEVLQTVPASCDIVRNDKVQDEVTTETEGEKVTTRVVSKTFRMRTVSCPPPVRMATQPPPPSAYNQAGYSPAGYIGYMGGVSTPQNPLGSIIPVGVHSGR